MSSIPYYPISLYEGIPQYSIFDVDIFGPPDKYGINKYFVLEEIIYDNSRILDDIDYQRPNVRERPVHHYDREQRFKWTLRVLLGGSRDPIPLSVLSCFHRGDIDWDPTRVWKSIRNALKIKGYAKYYNRIPEILQWHYYPYKINIPPTINYQEMYRSFKKMHYKFDHSEWAGRTYFPNLRYIILKMLLERGVVFEYSIPLLHTKAKLPVLEQVWKTLISKRFIVKIHNQKDTNTLLSKPPSNHVC